MRITQLRKTKILKEIFLNLIDLTLSIALLLLLSMESLAPHLHNKLIMAKSTKPVKSSPPKDFEAGLAELESIVTSMEAGQMSLEVSLLAHKRGVELLQYCQTKLQSAQQQVRLLETNTLKNFSPTSIDER